jgi:hypothetical protein
MRRPFLVPFVALTTMLMACSSPAQTVALTAPKPE